MEYPYSILGKDACQQTASFSYFQDRMKNHTTVPFGYNTVVLYWPILENCFFLLHLAYDYPTLGAPLTTLKNWV